MTADRGEEAAGATGDGNGSGRSGRRASFAARRERRAAIDDPTVVLEAAAADAFIARVIAADGAAPFTADLNTQRISGPGGPDVTFEIAPAERMRLLEGLDDIGLTFKHMDDIANWEQRAAATQPWIQSVRDSR